jgi:uncharacterized protein YecT (DUF1311 family)
MRRAIIILCFMAISTSAAADDSGQIDSCIAERGDAAASCIGVIAQPCQERPGGETTVGIVACLQQETAAWDALLNRYYTELRKTKAEPARTTLRDAQRAWIGWRDADCRFAYEQFGGGSLRQVAGAACLRDRTAERVLHLHGYLNYGN